MRATKRLKQLIKSVPLLGPVARRAYLLTFGAEGLVDWLRYYQYAVLGDGWCRVKLGDEEFAFRCSNVAETRRNSVAVRKERPVIERLRSLCEPGMTVFDLGANVGTHGIPLGVDIGETGTVVCFEPHSKTFEALQANVRRNDASNVQTENIALGATSGSIELQVETDMSGVGSHSIHRRTPEIETTEEARIMTGDEYVRSSDLEPDLVKIDVEGGEMGVLRGLEDTLHQRSPILVVECHDIVETEDLHDFLEQFGYAVSRMTDRKDIFIAR